MILLERGLAAEAGGHDLQLKRTQPRDKSLKFSKC